MAGEWFAALEASALARSLRDSVWTYPLVNAGHIFGVALLVGSVVPLDLRLLGFLRAAPLAPLWHVLSRTAAAGLAIAAVCGALLFVARAAEYVASTLFLAKMALVALGVANALALRRIASGGAPEGPGGMPPAGVRLIAGVSLAAWLTALTLGRLVGYF